jgi:FkbH-like protein
LREIASELNIGLDSIIFIDDNPVERAGIISEMPEITVPEFPSDTSELNKFITEIYHEYLLSLRTTAEDLDKTRLYRQNTKRDNLMKSSDSYETFLQSLDTKIRISPACIEDIPRISQLTQKTNQFNLTTRRYSEAEIKLFIDSESSDIYIASVDDKFGYNGKVGIIIIKKADHKAAEIDTFLLSCRVMGRYIEDQLVGFIEDRLAEEGFEVIKSCYLPTGKNKSVECLFERLGYQLEKSTDTGEKYYSLSLPAVNKADRRQFGQLVE